MATTDCPSAGAVARLPTGTLAVELRRGEPRTLTLAVTAGGAALDLTGYSAAASVYPPGRPDLPVYAPTVAIDADPTTGALSVTWDDYTALTASRYDWRLVLTLTDPWTLLTGSITLAA